MHGDVVEDGGAVGVVEDAALDAANNLFEPSEVFVELGDGAGEPPRDW